MSSMLPPVKNAEFLFYVSLVSTASPNIFKTSATLANGDVIYFGDGASMGNVVPLPVEIGTTGVISCSMAASSMNYDYIAVLFHDSSGGEWQDALVSIYTTTQTFAGGLSASALTEISAKSASGVWNNAARVITGGSVVATSGSVIATNVLAIGASAINASAIAASSFYAGAFSASTIDGTVFALTAGSQVWNSAIRTLSDKTDYGISASAIDEIGIKTASSIWTETVRTITGGSVVATSGSVIVTEVLDKTGYGLSASAIDEIADSLVIAPLIVP